MSEEVLTRHRKEIKALEGEKRAALKKIKGTKGKKGKELLQTTETEYDNKLKELKAKHQEELNTTTDTAPAVPTPSEEAAEATEEQVVDKQAEVRERKQAKARRKREKAKQAELDRQAQIEKETKEAGPSARQMELEQMKQQLSKHGLAIEEVPSDGNCLYRAVAAQCGANDTSYTEIRAKCADALVQHSEDFMPFCEYNDKVPDFDVYVDRVRNSSDWGGHLELRALSMALERPIQVYSVSTPEPLLLGQDYDQTNPIRVSYHLHYFALGEHYNQVVPVKEDEE